MNTFESSRRRSRPPALERGRRRRPWHERAPGVVRTGRRHTGSSAVAPSLTRVGLKSGFVTQRSPSIRARADRAAPRDYAVSIQTMVLQHLLRGGRVKRPCRNRACSARETRRRLLPTYATFRIAPAGTTPVVTYRHSAITSWRATATMPIRRARFPVPNCARYHWVKTLCGCQCTQFHAS
jgi:hypothetical protein